MKSATQNTGSINLFTATRFGLNCKLSSRHLQILPQEIYVLHKEYI